MLMSVAPLSPLEWQFGAGWVGVGGGVGGQLYNVEREEFL